MLDKETIRQELALRARLIEQAEVQRAALLADLFDKQIEFINDPSKQKTLVCGRRAGKTHALSRYLVKTALERPGANSRSLYVSLTKPHAVDLLWNELTRYCDALMLGCRYDNNRHTISFPNGHVISFGGVSSKDEREKHRGFPYHLIICDETGSFGPYLGYLLEDVLGAALLDYDGTIVLAGTPAPQAAGAFYDAAHAASGWKGWHWTVLDNPRIPQWAGKDNWRDIARAFLSSVESKTPSVKFKREYLGKWIRDVDSLLYVLEPSINLYDELPSHAYDYVIGADTGYNDASAIVCLAASKATKDVFLVDEWSQSGVLIDRLAAELQSFSRRYPQAAMVIDPANKQLVESMRQIYHLPLEAADKLGKRSHIDVLNSALHQGTVKFRRKSPTYEQMSVLEWNVKRTAESETFPADLADAMLYAYTHVYNHHNRPEVPKPLTENEWAREEERKMIEAAVAKVQGKNNDPLAFNEPDWGFSDD